MIDIVIVDDLDSRDLETYLYDKRSRQPSEKEIIYVKSGELERELNYTKEYLKAIKIDDNIYSSRD